MGGRRRGALLTIGAVAAACALPATSSAATVVPTSFTGCYGTLAHDKSGKTGGEPNLLDYRFHCNTPITAYTVLANQNGDHRAAIDDFAPSPTVTETDGVTPAPTESVTCEGTLPSDGINCNTGALGATIAPEYFIAGTIDLVQPYCKHLPTTAKGKLGKPGTPAVGTAIVQYVVTDNTGAEDGPFTLSLPKACPAVPARVPATTASARHSR